MRLFALTLLASAALIVSSAQALESTAGANASQMAGLKQMMDARFAALEALINGLQGNVNNIETNLYNCAGDFRFLMDTSGTCTPLWTYSSTGPEVSFDGDVVIGTPGASSYKLDIGGQVRSTGYFHNSDVSLKTNVVALDGLAIVKSLNGVRFDWTDGTGTAVGLIAQDVEKVLPEVVTTDATNGLKAVDYAKVVAPLIEAVKTLEARVAALEAEKAAAAAVAGTE